MILNDNSTQQINTLVIQLQNRITNLINESNKKVSEINDKISDLDTLKKEIADLTKNQINVDSSMNKQITENKNNIAANTSAISALNTQIQTNNDNIATNTSDISALKTSVAGKADKSHTHTKSEITDFPTSLPANGGTATKASFLDEYVGAGGTRPTSINFIPKDASEYGGMRKDVVTSSMTDSGHPGQDGHLLTMFWDNGGRWDSQLFVSNEKQPTTVKVRVKDNEVDYGPWVDIITSQNIGSQTVARASTADNDANGNNIVNTYATKTELEKTTTKSLGLNTVSSDTTKYIKLGTFHWYDSGISLMCRLGGDSFQDVVNINILNGNSRGASVCGYYSTNSQLTQAIIVKRGDSWSSDIEIYLQVRQLTTIDIYVTIDKGYQDRINISESTTAPSGNLGTMTFDKINGVFYP